MRTYEQTHHWLRFQVDLSIAAPSLWISLGECQSKCEHIARVPLRPDTSERLFKVYLAKGALASSAIEGNTLTEQQVLEHLEGRLELPPSQRYLQKEVDNIIKVCNEILTHIPTGTGLDLDSDRIKRINAQVLDGLPLPDYVVPGTLRTYPVTVGSYRGVPPEDCEFLLDRLCQWLSSDPFTPRPGYEIATAILKSIVAHLYMAWIHPFGDGNGRTARLIEFQILISSGVPAPAAHLLSNHYNQTRTEYYRQLVQASSSGGDIMPFVLYAVQGFLDGLKSQLDLIWEQEWDITWRNYVHELLGREPGRTATRRRHLALDLSRKNQAVPIAEIPQISPRMAKEYANKTQKTITRDLKELIKRGVAEKTAIGYRAKKEIIISFLPQRVPISRGA
jgi:Fic family protein